MFTLNSSDFAHEGEIPIECTGEGEDRPPSLRWSGVPEGCQSLVLIVDDPDAPDPKTPKTQIATLSPPYDACFWQSTSPRSSPLNHQGTHRDARILFKTRRPSGTIG